MGDIFPRMTETPEIIVLREIRSLRPDVQATMEAVATSMNQTKRVYERLQQFHDDVTALRAELRQGFLKSEMDIVSLENQSVSRHGDAMNLARNNRNLSRLIMHLVTGLAAITPNEGMDQTRQEAIDEVLHEIEQDEGFQNHPRYGL